MARKNKDKKMVGILAIALIVLGFLGAVQMNLIPGVPNLFATVGPQVVADGQQITPVTGGVQVNVGTPTLEWYVQNVITTAEVSLTAWAPMRVTVGGTTTDLQSNDSVDASLGDSYTVCLKPNASYYSKCVSGKIEKTVTKVNIPVYALGSVSAWFNNDPENSTTRNAVGAPDTLAAGDTDTPTFCLQGATANASFGNGRVLVVIDYNGNQLAATPTFSKGTLAPEKIPSAYVPDSNVGTSKTAYEISGILTNNETICGTITLVNGATKTAGFNWSGLTITTLDYFQFRDGSTDKLAEGYAITNAASTDTNSATNGSNHYYVI